MRVGKLFCSILCLFVFLNTSLMAQREEVSFDSLGLKKTTLLFEEYVPIGKFCENKKEEPIHCELKSKLFDNSIEELIVQHSDALTYLSLPYEIILKEELEKDIYKDKAQFRYFFEYKPTIGKKANSCLSNPGALLIKFSVYDRLKDERFDLNLKYSLFICDIQILVNEINKSIKEKKSKKSLTSSQ